MEVKAKSTLYIIGSFVIGILIGAIITITIMKPQGKRVDFRKKGSFTERMMDLIKPMEAQRDSVEQIIKKYEDKMIEQHKHSMELYRERVDSLNSELKRVLNDEQYHEFEKYLEERKQRYRNRYQRNTNERGK